MPSPSRTAIASATARSWEYAAGSGGTSDGGGPRAAGGAQPGGGGKDMTRAARVGDTAVGRREVPDLRLPAAVIAGELVDEQQRLPRACLLRVQRDAVVGHDCWHDGFSPSGRVTGLTVSLLSQDRRP